MYENVLKSTESIQMDKAKDNTVLTPNSNNDIMKSKENWHTDLNKSEFKMVEEWVRRVGYPETQKLPIRLIGTKAG